MNKDKEYLKNYLISKLFAINAVSIENTIINEQTNETKQYVKLNSNIIIKHPELFVYFLKYITFYSLFDEPHFINICGINPFGSLFSHFVSHYYGINHVNFSSLKNNYNDENINNLIINNNFIMKPEIVLFCDAIKNKENLKEVIDVLEKTYCKSRVYVLLDKNVSLHNNESLDNIRLYLAGNPKYLTQTNHILPIFKESDFYDYLNPSIETNIFSNKLANNMYQVALTKKSNIIFSCNLTNIDEICNAIHRLGSHIVGVKLNSENIYNFHKEPKERLKYLKKIYNLFFIDDKKFSSEYDHNFISLKNKPYQLLDWADAITIQSNCMDNLLATNWEINNYEDLNILLINNSNNNEIFNKYFNDNTLKHLKNKSVCGYVSKKNLNNDNQFLKLNMTEEYSNIDSYKENNKLFWCLGNNILRVDNLEKMTKKVEKYKKLGFEYFIKY